MEVIFLDLVSINQGKIITRKHLDHIAMMLGRLIIVISPGKFGKNFLKLKKYLHVNTKF